MKKPSIKTLMLMFVLIGFISFPDVMLELKAKLLYVLAVIVHTVYEAGSFVMEEWLIHSFHVEKFTAQMLVFYFHCLIAAGIAYGIWRRLPSTIRRLQRRWNTYVEQRKIDALITWQTMPSRQKAQLVMIQLVGVASGFLWLMA